MNLIWTNEIKEDPNKGPNIGYVVGHIGVMTLLYIFHRYTEGDLFTPSEDYYELCINGSFLNPEEFFSGKDYDLNGYLNYKGTLDECKNISEKLIKFNSWDEFIESDIYNKIIEPY